MRMIITVGMGADRPEDYAALKTYLRANFPAPPTELVSANPVATDTLVNRLAQEFNLPVTRFPIDWSNGDGSNNPAAGKLRVGDMVVYASESETGSACVVVSGVVHDFQRHVRTVCQTYGVACHLVRVAPTRFDAFGKADVPVGAKDITPVVTVTRDAAVAPTPYIFPQSHSSLNVFDTCPRQYEAKYITKDSPYVQNDAAKWGDEVHNALEHYLKSHGSEKLPTNMAMYERFGDWVLNRAAARGGTILAERMIAVDSGLAAVPYRSKARWMGGKIDVTILYPQSKLAEVFDWKTGKMKNDQTQLQMYGALTLAQHPEVDTVATGYIWLGDSVISPPVYYQRPDYALHWDTFQVKYLRLKEAYVRGVFPPKPNGLCRKWCDVTRCEFHGVGGR